MNRRCHWMGWSLGLMSCVGGAGSLCAADWPQWRGPDRDALAPGAYAQHWPQAGPRQIWSITTRAAGYAAPAVVAGRIYLTGTEATEEGRVGRLYVLDAANGAGIWAREYGPEWERNYDRSRSTPTVVGDRVYVISGLGRVVCFEAESGDLVWSVDTFERFSGSNIRWGIAESPLVYDDLVICHPGGPDAAVVALDAATGETRWTSRGLDDRSAYCSPMLTTLAGVRQVVTQTAGHVVGLDAATGEVLWRTPHVNRYAVHPNTPLVLGEDRIAVSSGYGFGTESYQVLRAPEGTMSVRRLWHTRELDNHFHGIVLHAGGLYGSGSRGGLYRLDPDTGAIQQRLPEIQRASLARLNDALITYSQRDGLVRLLEADAEGFRVRGEFTLDLGDGPHWAHPTVADGVLYMRRGRGLAAFDIGVNPR